MSTISREKNLGGNNYHWNCVVHSGKKKDERIRRIPSHGVAALSAFGIEQGNPFRDCMDFKLRLTLI